VSTNSDRASTPEYRDPGAVVVTDRGWSFQVARMTLALLLFLEKPGAYPRRGYLGAQGGNRLCQGFPLCPSRFQLRSRVSPPWLTGVSASKFRGTVKLQCICKKSPNSRHFTSHELPLNPSLRSKDLLPTVRLIRVYGGFMADSLIDRFCNPIW
jgi:hypothetical protein